MGTAHAPDAVRDSGRFFGQSCHPAIDGGLVMLGLGFSGVVATLFQIVLLLVRVDHVLERFAHVEPARIHFRSERRLCLGVRVVRWRRRFRRPSALVHDGLPHADVVFRDVPDEQVGGHGQRPVIRRADALVDRESRVVVVEEVVGHGHSRLDLRHDLAKCSGRTMDSGGHVEGCLRGESILLHH